MSISSSQRKPVPRPTQRAGGVFIAACGAFVAWLAWGQAHTEPRFSLAGAFLGPAFAIMGAALVIFPGYREERIARGEDVSGKEGAELMTARWWAILLTGLAAGAAYTLALRNGWL